jgi:chloramphenicol O-acetyltransferase type A
MTERNFETILLDNYPRADIYRAFRKREIPFYSTTFNVDITQLSRHANTNLRPITLILAYCIAKTANRIKEFKQRVVEDDIREYEITDPSLTVLNSNNTFSFCDAVFVDDLESFLDINRPLMKSAKDSNNVGTEPKDHRIFITSIPWIEFTSFTHPYMSQYGYIPIFTMGKFIEQQEKVLLPLAIQVNHALIDGYHLGAFCSQFQQLLNEF